MDETNQKLDVFMAFIVVLRASHGIARALANTKKIIKGVQLNEGKNGDNNILAIEQGHQLVFMEIDKVNQEC